jgi:hypothetical protein
MINMLKIPQHGIETITTHMNIVTSPKKIKTMNQMFTNSRPIEIRVPTDFIVVAHLASRRFIIVIYEGLAVVEMRKFMCKVTRAFLVKPAASKRVIVAAEGFGFRG